MTRTRTAVVVLGIATFCAGVKPGGTQEDQFPTIQNPGRNQPGIPGRTAAAPDVDSAMRDKQVAMRNTERQRRLVADTDKLLQLATQLHADVAKTDQHILSLDVVRRAEEIEKLARGVKERMKN